MAEVIVFQTGVLPVEQIRKMDDPELPNPQTMSEGEYAMLLNKIMESGFMNPILVRPPKDKRRKVYDLVHGEHRYDAAIDLGMTEVPVVFGDPNWTDEECRIKAAQLNNIHGEPADPVMRALVKSIEKRTGITLSARDMGMSKTAWDRMIIDATKGLPPKVAQRVREVATHDRDAEAIGEIVHQIMLEQAGQMDRDREKGFVVFSFGGKEVHLFQLNRALYGWVTMLESEARQQNRHVSDILEERVM